MTCALCGVNPNNGLGLCSYHTPIDEGWAGTNRIMCDFLHRRQSPKRLMEQDRFNEMLSEEIPA